MHGVGSFRTAGEVTQVGNRDAERSAGCRDSREGVLGMLCMCALRTESAVPLPPPLFNRLSGLATWVARRLCHVRTQPR